VSSVETSQSSSNEGGKRRREDFDDIASEPASKARKSDGGIVSGQCCEQNSIQHEGEDFRVTPDSFLGNFKVQCLLGEGRYGMVFLQGSVDNTCPGNHVKPRRKTVSEVDCQRRAFEQLEQ